MRFGCELREFVGAGSRVIGPRLCFSGREGYRGILADEIEEELVDAGVLA
jgi:hypothetical protein